MAELLQRLIAQGPVSAHASRILEAFPATARTPCRGARPARRTRRCPLETLTWREAEVLDLLAARLSNKKIAARLGISTETVKQHATNIYQKLQVSGRRAAVSRARALGLLAHARGRRRVVGAARESAPSPATPRPPRARMPPSS